jgi:corrinoid protein of di/trimethylamine methyltransferase
LVYYLIKDFARNCIQEEIQMLLKEISAQLQAGKSKMVKELVQQAIDEGISAQDILEKGLLDGMNIIGEKFKKNEVFVPEVLVAARAMNQGTMLLKPLLAESGVPAAGKACIGTVEGDLHDIGKNLVKMMLEGKGLEVIDLGVDVPAEKFVSAAIENNCQIICCSALLTTTMGVMKDVVDEAVKAGVRDKVKIMIGGAPITDEYCKQIGADAYTLDAASAADKAVELLSK